MLKEIKWGGTPSDVMGLLKEGDTPALRAYITDWMIRSGTSRGLSLTKKPQATYLDRLRTLLRQQIANWIDSGMDPQWIRDNHLISEFLKLSRPAPIVHMGFHETPLEIFHEPPSAADPAMEAARLLLVVLTSKDARKVKRCLGCEAIFLGPSNRKHCSDACKTKRYRHSEAFQRKHNEYILGRRERDIDQLIRRAAALGLQGDKLVRKLNEGLSERPLRYGTYGRHKLITQKWVTRHQKAIESQRRKYAKR
jgi:hypothetical protein